MWASTNVHVHSVAILSDIGTVLFWFLHNSVAILYILNIFMLSISSLSGFGNTASLPKCLDSSASLHWQITRATWCAMLHANCPNQLFVHSMVVSRGRGGEGNSPAS